MADQINVTWKADSNGKQIFQAALEKWGADKPKAGAGDFILDLIRIANKAEKAIETSDRLEALGIKELVEMHQRRAAADTRMLEQIADLIADAQGKAEEAVKAEMDALRKSKEILETSIQKVTGELEKSGQELEATKAEFERISADKAETDKQNHALLAELSDIKAKLNETVLAREQAASQLEQERLATITLKENAVKHESEINKLQKQANDAETVYRQRIAELEQQFAKLQTEQAKAQLEADNKIERLQSKYDQLSENLNQVKAEREQAHKEKQERERAVAELNNAEIAYRQRIAELEQQLAKLQTEQAKAQLEADNKIERLQSKCDQLSGNLDQVKAEREQAHKEKQEKEMAVAELAEARVKVSALEATVKAQQESISQMGKTMDVLRNFRAVNEKQSLKISSQVIPLTKTANQPNQQDKSK